MCPLQLLGPPLADHMLRWIQMPTIRAPAVGVKAANPKRREQRFEFHQYPIRTATKGVGHDPACPMIERRPQSPRLFLAADEGPHLVQLRCLDLAEHHRGQRSLPSRYQ